MDYRTVPANALAELCAQTGTAGAWEEFVHRFQRPIALSVLRTARAWGDPSPALVEDLVQETFVRLCSNRCRLLHAFESREPDSIVGYLKVIAASVTHDHFRSEKAIKRGGNLIRHQSERGEADAVFGSHREALEIEKQVQRSEIDLMLRASVPESLSAQDCTVFWLYFEQGFSAREIADLPDIELSIKGVESSIHRATRHLREVMHREPNPATAGDDFVSVSTAASSSDRPREAR